MRVKNIVIFLVILNCTLISTAQNWLWSGGATGANLVDPKGIAIDDDDNIYILGQFKDTTTVGPQILISDNNSEDIFIAKFDNNGTLSWVKKAGGTQMETPKAIAVDDDGNVYITGAFIGSAGFGPDPLDTIVAYADANEDIFLAKYSTNGNIQWAINAGSGPGKERSTGIVVDQSGDITIIGFFNDGLVFSGFSFLNTYGENTNFIAKFNNNGGFIWANAYVGTNKKTRFIEIRVCETGGVNLGYYVGGFFYNNLTIGTDVLTSLGEGDIMVFRINNDGGVVWVKKAGGISDDQCYSITSSSNGDVYLTGYIHGNVNFGTIPLSTFGGADAFLAKYDKDGNILWANKEGGSGDDLGAGIYTVNSNIYMTGYFSGTTVWNLNVLSSGSTSNKDAFFGGFNSDGEVLWGRGMSGELEDRGVNIVASTNENIFLSGYYYSDSLFVGSDTLLNGGVLQNLFYIKYGCNEINILAENYTDISCNGQNNATITVEAEGDNPMEYSINGGLVFESNNGEFTGLSEGDYSIIVKDVNNCIETGSTITITNPYAIQVNSVNASNETAAGASDGQITVSASGGTGVLTYSLTPNDTSNTSGIFTNLPADKYVITITDQNNCTDTLESEIFLILDNEINIYSAFTPNGDDKNQAWNIKNIDLFPNCNVKIYNSWGNLIYSSVGYADPWNGAYNGNLLPSATYYYIIDLGDGSKVRSGAVTLIR